MESRSYAVGGLMNYIRSIANHLGDEVVDVDVDTLEAPATAIIAMESRIPALVEFPLLLTWDEINGWALRIVMNADCEVAALEYLGEDLLPNPDAVVRFVDDATRGDHHPGVVVPPIFSCTDQQEGLESRLASFRN